MPECVCATGVQWSSWHPWHGPSKVIDLESRQQWEMGLAWHGNIMKYSWNFPMVSSTLSQSFRENQHIERLFITIISYWNSLGSPQHAICHPEGLNSSITVNSTTFICLEEIDRNSISQGLLPNCCLGHFFWHIYRIYLSSTHIWCHCKTSIS